MLLAFVEGSPSRMWGRRETRVQGRQADREGQRGWESFQRLTGAFSHLRSATETQIRVFLQTLPPPNTYTHFL